MASLPNLTPTQVVTLQYLNPANSRDINRRPVDVIPTGIYKGGYFTINSDVATLTDLVCEIRSNGEGDDYQIRSAITGFTFNIQLTGTWYVVLRWTYTNGENNVSVEEVGSVTSPYDIVIGSYTKTGPSTYSISYADRDNAAVTDLYLKVEPNDTTPTSSVRVKGGKVQISGTSKTTLVDIADQLVSLDGLATGTYVIYVTSAGSVTLFAKAGATGTYYSLLGLAEVTYTSGSPIVAANIKDVRQFLTQPAIPDDISVQRRALDGKLAAMVDNESMEINATKSLRTRVDNESILINATKGLRAKVDNTTIIIGPNGLTAVMRIPKYTIKVGKSSNTSNPNTTIPGYFVDHNIHSTGSIVSYGSIMDSGYAYSGVVDNRSVMYEMVVTSTGTNTRYLYLHSVDDSCYVYVNGSRVFACVEQFHAGGSTTPRTVTLSLFTGTYTIQIIHRHTDAESGGMILIGDIVNETTVKFGTV